MVDQPDCGIGRPRDFGRKIVPDEFTAIAFDRGNARAETSKSASLLASRPRKRTFAIGCAEKIHSANCIPGARPKMRTSRALGAKRSARV